MTITCGISTSYNGSTPLILVIQSTDGDIMNFSRTLKSIQIRVIATPPVVPVYQCLLNVDFRYAFENYARNTPRPMEMCRSDQVQVMCKFLINGQTVIQMHHWGILRIKLLQSDRSSNASIPRNSKRKKQSFGSSYGIIPICVRWRLPYSSTPWRLDLFSNFNCSDQDSHEWHDLYGMPAWIFM